jgi:hypothetical protein
MRQSRALKDIIRQDQDGVWFIDLFHFPENDSIDTETRATSKSMIGPRIGLSFSNSPLIFATKLVERGIVRRELSFAHEVTFWPDLITWHEGVIKHKTAIFRQVNLDKRWAHHDALEFPEVR